jgi:hypothetical protein
LRSWPAEGRAQFRAQAKGAPSSLCTPPFFSLKTSAIYPFLSSNLSSIIAYRLSPNHVLVTKIQLIRSAKATKKHKKDKAVEETKKIAIDAPLVP